MKKSLFLLCGISIFYAAQTSAQGFYAVDTIQKIEISFSQSNWDYMLDTAKNGSETYIMAQWVRINGVQIDSVGVKYKGNSSYDSSNVKNPLHIELNAFVPGQDYQGYKDIKLNNGWLEPSMVRDVLGYKMLGNYMHCPKANYAQVYINGTYYGLYPNVEVINKGFVDNRFYSSDNPFFKCNPLIYDLQYFPTLEYLGADSTSYYNNYEIKSDFGWQSLINLCDTLANNSSNIHKILDVDRALWMLAFNNVIVNLDSYTGVGSQNYYLYMDNTEHFNTIIWDINMCFGSFNVLVPGPSGQLTITQMQQLSPVIQSTNSQKPLIQKLLADSMYKRMYIAHMRTILNEHFANGSYITEAQNLASIIDTAFQSDPNTFFSYSEFQNAITQNTISGPLTIPGIQVLMDARTTYLNSTAEFQQIPPTVSNIQPSDTFPAINSNIYFTADITNATAVYLGLRYSVMEKFSRMSMYDDGSHGDGAAGDGIYGISVPVISSEIHYYIYAENNNAGIFSPERAEHEYYIIQTKADIIINEFMASNQNTAINPSNGKYSDWIELYNTTSNAVDLSGWYLSDKYDNPYKWQFPNTIISANDFLIIWASGDTLQVLTGLNTNYKLSTAGESVVLSNAAGLPQNYVNYSQQYNDISYARYPNGTDNWCFALPTYDNFNTNPCLFSDMNEYYSGNTTKIYPNPASSNVIIDISGNTDVLRLDVYNFLGKLVYQDNIKDRHILDVSGFDAGVYIVRIGNLSAGKLIVR